MSYLTLRFVVFSLLLLPSLSVVPGVPAIRLDDLLLLGWFFVFVLFSGIKNVVVLTGRDKYILALMLFLPLSVLNGLVNGYEGSFGDINQYIRFLKYLAIYYLSMVCFWRASRYEERKRIIDFFILCGVGLFGISIFQYFDFLGLNAKYVKSISPNHYHTLVDGYPHPRPVGMIGNPNELGFVMAIMSLLSVFGFVFYGQRRYVLFSSFFLVGILMSMSRSSLIAFFCGVVVLVLLFLIKAKFVDKIKAVLFFCSFLLVAVWISFQPIVYEAVTWRFEKGVDLSEDDSAQVRMENWSENIEIIKRHPLVGVGPLRRAEIAHAADNEWLLNWRSYGLLGSIFIAMIVFSGLFKEKEFRYQAFHISIAISVFIYMIPAAAFHSLVIFPLVLFVLALIDSQKYVSKGQVDE